MFSTPDNVHYESASFIPTAMLDLKSFHNVSSTGYTSIPILSTNIPNLSPFYTFIVKDTPVSIPIIQSYFRIYIIIHGVGSINANDKTIEVEERGVYVAPYETPLIINTTTSLIVLELQWHMSSTDIPDLPSPDRLPYYQSYNTAPTYSEAIKSSKTISRTLCPPRLIPRFAMGSVYTTGPDQVAAHRHPMLQQLFFSFKENDSTVSADDISIHMKDEMLLHIPLGSMHGVTVKEGSILHYVWMDFFAEKKGLEWIDTMHKDN